MFLDWRVKAETGDPEAQYQTARNYWIGVGVPKDRKAARSWYEKAAEQGHTEAQYELGRLCRIQADTPAARQWLSLAAAQNHAKATTELATYYGSGEGLPRADPVKACTLFRQAAMLGEPFAMYCLARRLLIGNGTAKDVEEAYYWAYSALLRKGYGTPDPECGDSLDELVIAIEALLAEAPIMAIRRRAQATSQSKDADSVP